MMRSMAAAISARVGAACRLYRHAHDDPTELGQRFEAGDVSIELSAIRPMMIALVFDADFDALPTHIEHGDERRGCSCCERHDLLGVATSSLWRLRNTEPTSAAKGAGLPPSAAVANLSERGRQPSSPLQGAISLHHLQRRGTLDVGPLAN